MSDTDQRAVAVVASLSTMTEWIGAKNGVRHVIVQGNRYYGPILLTDAHHAVQKCGRSSYVVHALPDLADPLVLNDPRLCIAYADGVGRVLESNDAPEARGHEKCILQHAVRRRDLY